VVLAPRSRRFRRNDNQPVSRRGNETVYLEIRSTEIGASALSASAAGAVLREASTATGHAEEARWRKSKGEIAEDINARVTPHLRHLMRDQVVNWLSRQRASLLESHEVGTQQVIDLQAQLERLKQQFQQRMVTQQQRIAELDSALRTKEKVILDLLRKRPPEDRG